MEVKVGYKNILVPVDFSDSSRKAFYVALKFAKIFDCETHVMHVFEPLESTDGASKVEQDAKELARLEDGVKRRVDELFVKGGLAEVDRRRIHVDVRAGRTWKEILAYVVEKNIDLLVIGDSGKTQFKEYFLGSTIEKVVKRAPCHVLSIKLDDYEYDPFKIPAKFKEV